MKIRIGDLYIKLLNEFMLVQNESLKFALHTRDYIILIVFFNILKFQIRFNKKYISSKCVL
jgi:hypothetical protein